MWNTEGAVQRILHSTGLSVVLQTQLIVPHLSVQILMPCLVIVAPCDVFTSFDP